MYLQYEKTNELKSKAKYYEIFTHLIIFTIYLAIKFTINNNLYVIK